MLMGLGYFLGFEVEVGVAFFSTSSKSIRTEGV